jgi:hypothetical protein
LKHEKLEPHQKFPVWKLSYRDGADEYTLYYSLGERTLFFSLDSDLLHELLDREAQGLEPKGIKDARIAGARRGTAAPVSRVAEELGDQTQFQAALKVAARGGLFTAIAWSLDYNPLDSLSYQQASLVYGAWGNRGPAVQRAFYDYWGEEPVTSDGRSYEFLPSGVADPARGGEFLLRWPRLPDPQSQIGKILASVFSISTSVGVEQEAPGREPQQQSLSIGLDVTKR